MFGCLGDVRNWCVYICIMIKIELLFLMCSLFGRF